MNCHMLFILFLFSQSVMFYANNTYVAFWLMFLYFFIIISYAYLCQDFLCIVCVCLFFHPESLDVDCNKFFSCIFFFYATYGKTKLSEKI